MGYSPIARATLLLALVGSAGVPSDATALVSGSLVDSSRLVVEGDAADTNVGSDVAAIGDFNGDGVGDLAFSVGGATQPQAVQLVFGGGAQSRERIGAHTRGVRFAAPDTAPSGTLVVSAAGDVNSDGLADMVVGSSLASPSGRDRAGSVFVLFGTRTPVSTVLGDPALAGFRVDGPDSDARVGTTVDGVGDVNGDGRSDVAVGSHPKEGDGRAFVVYGRSSGGVVDLAALGNDGFEIATERGTTSPAIVSAAGDANGDGTPDVVVLSHGRADVVFGQPRQGVVDLSETPGAGIRITGASLATVAAAGDFNADGRGDLVLGAPRGSGASAPGAGDGPSGGAVVVFGSGAGSVDTRTLGERGLSLRRSGSGDDLTGAAVAPAGDFDGDGFADIALGAPGESRVYVVRGGRQAGGLRLTSTGNRVIRFDVVSGPGDPAYAGTSLDGGFSWPSWTRPAILVGAPRGDLAGDNRGRAYVVPGFKIGTCRNRQTAPSGGASLTGSISGDRLIGSRSSDRLLGLEGADCLFGGPGVDDLVGGRGNDRLDGGAGRDRVDGGEGADTLIDHRGSGTRFSAGRGNDRIDARNGGRDRIDCGPGTDRVRGDRADKTRGCERVRRYS